MIPEQLLGSYLPQDRRRAVLRGASLPDRALGALLFVDISGFTALGDTLARIMGPRRGSEELTRQLNRIYDGLIAEIDRYGGSVISFNGDGLLCWFDELAGRASARALASAFRTQQALSRMGAIALPSGQTVVLGLKTIVTSGPVRRFVVGDPALQLIDTLAGQTVTRLAGASHLVGRNEVLIDEPTLYAALDVVDPDDCRPVSAEPPAVRGGARAALVLGGAEDVAGERFFVATRLHTSSTALLRPAEPAPSKAGDAELLLRPWLLPALYRRLRDGQGEFLPELRPVTSMFVGFDGIDYDRDDDAGQKLDAYMRWAQNVANQNEGALLELSIDEKGSYLHVVYGTPIAHQDDAARAVQGAQALLHPEAALDFIHGVKIGLSQGTMHTGSYGSVTRRSYNVTGDQINVAARLMQLAEPGEVLASEALQKALDHSFTWKDMPPALLKGKSDPLPVYALLGAANPAAHSGPGPTAPTLLVGRQSELARLNAKMDEVAAGRGQVVAIVAEAGLGKSRLVAEALQAARARGWRAYTGAGQPGENATAYQAWQPIWYEFFGFNNTRAPGQLLPALAQEIASIDVGLLPYLHLAGPLAQVALPDNDRTRGLSPHERKVLRELLVRAAVRARLQGYPARPGTTPVILVLEDIQWLDPLSDDLLNALGQISAELPVLLLLTYRPDELLSHKPHVAWQTWPHFYEIRLGELGDADAEALIRARLADFGAASTPVFAEEIVRRVRARAQGNPFYIDEVLKYLLHQRLTSPATMTLDLPASLHSLMLSRIDQLSEQQRATLKVASVVGRHFELSWLQGCGALLSTPEQLRADLKRLSELELIVPEGQGTDVGYAFKHIVVQEVAYQSLTYDRRATLHEQVGRYLETHTPEGQSAPLDVLAYHFLRSQNEDKKRHYLLQAGTAAQAVYANNAAIQYYEHLLPVLARQDQAVVALRLGAVLELVGRLADAENRYRQALTLAASGPDTALPARAQRALGALLRQRSDYQGALAWLHRARVAFLTYNHKADLCQTLAEIGSVLLSQGAYQSAQEVLETSRALATELMDSNGLAVVLHYQGRLAEAQGRLAEAQARFNESLVISQPMDFKWGIARALDKLADVNYALGDFAAARTQAQESLELSRQIGDRWGLGRALATLGNIAAGRGEQALARDYYRASLAIKRELLDTHGSAQVLIALAAVDDDPAQAVQFMAAAANQLDRLGAVLEPVFANLDRQARAQAQARSGAPAYARAWLEGEALPLENALELALGSTYAG